MSRELALAAEARRSEAEDASQCPSDPPRRKIREITRERRFRWPAHFTLQESLDSIAEFGFLSRKHLDHGTFAYRYTDVH